MGSTYRPSRRGRAADRYESHPLPPPPPPRRDGYSERRDDDRYRPSDRDSHYRPSYDRDSHNRGTHYESPRDNGNAGYSFRGAGAAPDRYTSRAEENFTFQSNGGPAAPRFPSAQEQPLPPRPIRRPPRDRPRGSGAPRGGDRGRRFGPRPAHSRDLLTRSTRETTPEQLAGMTGDAQPKFRDSGEYTEDSDSEDDADHANDNGAHKRRKREKVVPIEQPKWSNPDPYTALPPPSQSIGPKKDIVETIRKAKMDTILDGASSNPVKDNIDFISFDDGPAVINLDSDDEDQASVGSLPVVPSRKRKRTHSEISPDDSLGGLITEEWEPSGHNLTPWMPTHADFTANVGLKLHKEIADFYEFVKPTESERVVRQEIATRIQTAIQGWYAGRGVQIYCFGSYPAGLYLPNADMDLVALSPRYLESAVPTFCLGMPDKRKLRSVLRSAGVFDPVKGADIIAFAKVPLIKFTDLQTGLKVDISFENHTGLTAQGTLQTWKEQFPDMPILVAVIKQFLCMRNLNEVFSGGIGGFTIICLVVSMLQQMPEVQADSHVPHTRYGELLLNFFDLYGNKFNYRDTGIIMDPPSYFDKLRDRDRMNIRYQDDRLTIIDPNRADNDISGGSRLIAEVFDCFRGAHALVQRRLNQVRLGKANSESILECILGGNYSTYFDTRARIRRVYQRNHHDGDAHLAAEEMQNSIPLETLSALPPPPPPPKRPKKFDRGVKSKKHASPDKDKSDAPPKKKKNKGPKAQAQTKKAQAKINGDAPLKKKKNAKKPKDRQAQKAKMRAKKTGKSSSE